MCIMVRSFKLLLLSGILIVSLFIAPVSPVYAIAIPAEINKQFTPIFIDAGGISVLRVSIFNPNTFQLTNASWSDNLVGVQLGLSIANPAGINNTCGGAVVAVPGTTAFSLSAGTVPAQVGAVPGECFVEINVTSTTPGNLINTIPTNNLVSTGNDGGTPVSITNTTPASATLTVVAVTPPSLSKAFTPSNTMWIGETRVLTITIRNNDVNTPLTQVSITDTLPVGVTVSGVPASPQCGGGIVTSTAGSVTLTGGTIAGNATCNLVLNVTSTTQGAYTNTIPAGPAGPGSIRTQQGVTNAAAATAPLNVQAIGLLKAFAPTPIAAGGVSTVTITLQNPTGAAYTGAAFTDTLPAGLTVFGTPASPQCGGTITSTTGTVTLAGGVIPASATPPLPLGTCTIAFQVTTPVNAPTATRTNTIPVGGLTTFEGVSNPAAVSTNLNVQAGLTVLKAFAPASFTAGGTSTVTVTLRNHTGAAFTGVNLTDTLPANLTVSGTAASPQCGGGIITNSPTAVTLTGGTIPAGTVAVPGTCTLVFQVTSSVAGVYSNTIPINDVITDQGVGNLTLTTSNNLTVVNAGGPVTVSKAFQTSPILPGAPSRLRITITAPTDIGVTGIVISDTLPGDLVIVGTPTAPANPVTTCGGVLTAGIGTQSIALTGGAIAAASGTCTITVYVTTNTSGVYPNTIPASNVTTTQGRTNTSPSNTANLTVTGLTMGKAFFPPVVNSNGLSRLTITLTNANTSSLVNVSLTDTLPGTIVNGVIIAPIPNASTTCTGGVITATAGTQTISMASGTVPAQVGAVPGVCTISVDVQGKGATATRTNTIPPASVIGTVQSTGTIINPFAQATANLDIAPLTIGVVKGFNPVLVYGGASSTMSLQLVNPNNAVLTGIAFTDDMNLLLSGMIIANPANLNVGTCGGVLTGNPGDTSFSFSGGVLPANSNCILTLSVSMNINGNRTNRIPVGAVTTFNGVSSPDPAEASLTNLPGASVSKVFTPNPILAGSVSTLTITIQNTSAIPLSGMELSDGLPGTLPAGLEIANPSNLTNTCNGTVTAAPGTQTIQLVGGTLAGNLSCAISVSVTSTIPGSYLNTIPAGALLNAEGATNNLPASDTLVITSPFFSLGNRVWFDTDNSGTINGVESGANGVTVQLYAADGAGNPTGAVLATQTTANGGYYRFDTLNAGDYVVVIPATQFGAGGLLDGYWSSSTTVSGTGVLSETAAPDPDNNTDSDDNGTLQTAGAFNGAVISDAVTLGPSNNEPINDTDADPTNPAGEEPNGQSNRTVDFGFYREQLGNLVFVDVNTDGVFNAGDTLLSGATVQLYASNGTTEINVGPDGILGTTDDAAGGVTTGVGGTYLFSGLPSGDYIVKVTPPGGYASTVDTGASTDTTNPNTNTNNNDNGVGTNGGQVSSNAVTLTPGSFGLGSNNNVTNTDGTTYDPTLDFGFTSISYSLGNRVWFDTDNSGTLNGAEVGISSVRVELYQDNGDGVYGVGDTFQSFATTDVNGYYRFDNLPAGDYVVLIPADNFRNVGGGDTVAGDPLSGYWSSETVVSGVGVIGDSTANDPDTTVTDSDDNGRTTFAGSTINYVASAAVTLGPGTTEPINEADLSVSGQGSLDNRADMTVDFGFYQVTLGDQVFIDVDNSGTYNAGDTNLSGATVQLFASNGTTEINVGPDGILGTSDDAAGGVLTGAGGTYLFSGLPGGDYIVKVTPPVGHSSTVDTADSTDTTNPNTNTNNNDNGVGVSTGQTSSNIVTLTAGNLGAASNNVVTNSTGITSNPTLDFGFTSLNYSLGNRIWFDTDNSGTLNGSEVGISSVRVELYQDNGDGVYGAGDIFQSFATTDANGYYRFDNLPAGDYVVLIPADNFRNVGGGDTVAGDPLSGYWSSETTISGAGAISDSTANDPDTTVTDSDDNGRTTFAGSTVNYVASAAVTLGPGTGEPTSEVDVSATGQGATDNRADMTVDFGFYRAALSNQIFLDVNNNGTFDAGDTGLAGATVRLYASNGTTEINVGPDGILGTADDAAGGVTTLAGGTYLFNGLPQGSYIVKVTPAVDHASAIDTASGVDTTNPNANIDNNDNGLGTGPGQVSSNVIPLTPGSAGASANNVVTNATGTTTNPTMDFGFTQALSFSLGNRVWFDTDNSGTINGAEAGVDGVTVQVYAADAGGNPIGAVLGTQITANDGYYRFDNLFGGDYVVVIPAGQFGTGGPLDGYWSSSTTISGAGVVSETAAPDPDNDTDSDDNGTLQTAGAFNGAVISSAITLGPTNVEPINDADADPTNPAGEAVNNQSNRSVDFGFYRTQLSNQIFTDVNNNGTFDAGDTGLVGASVQLYASNGTTEINVGSDGILGTADDAAGGVTTGAGGTYLFSGLPQGDYIVKVTPPTGYSSTVDTANNGDTTTPNNNINNNDNGVGTSIGQASSNVVTLTPGNAGAATNNVITNATGTTTNPTVDFGFIPTPFSLGNRVWFDTDNSATLNGTEVGVNGVTVQVYAADAGGNPTGAVLDTQVTVNGGYYRFDNLIAGDYVVVIPASQFGAGGLLDGYLSSETTLSGAGVVSETLAPDPDNDTDNEDNGTLQTAGAFNGAVISSAVTLGPTNVEPTNDTDADPTNPAGEAVNNQSNRTVDFGFYRSALSNQVFTDVNNNGTFDAGDTALPGATVHLYASNGTTEINVGPDGILGTADDAAGGVTTLAGGIYLFSGLPQGSYIVKVTPPVGNASAIDTASGADTTNPNTNIDNNDNGLGVGVGQVSSNAVILTPGNAGAAANNVVTNATGTTTNPTLDFGFVPASTFSLGNRVWFDTNNSSDITLSEVGVQDVIVQLFAADGTTPINVGPDGILGTVDDAGGNSVLTDANGYYLFNNLQSGNYVVVLSSDNFTTGVLKGYWSSGTNYSDAGLLQEDAADGDTDIDNNDNGTLQTNGTVKSSVITLGPTITSEQTGETDLAASGQGQPDAQANMTVDFGFYTMTLGDLVWNDADNNGLVNAETVLANVDVQLWSKDLSTLIATDTTDVSGNYLFVDLPKGNYVLRIPAAEFNPGGTLRDYISSTGTGSPFPYEPAPNAETDTTNSDDNGSAVGTTLGPDGTYNSSLGLGGYVQSSVFTLTPAAEATVDMSLGLTNEPRIDFGFFAESMTDLAITKTDGVGIYIANGTLNYTITVTNKGPGDVTNAQVDDVIPTQIASWSWTCAAGTPVARNCTGATSNSSSFQDFIDLPQGTSVTYNVAVVISASPTGALNNTVTIGNSITELTPTDNTATDQDDLASLQVTKDDGVSIISAENTITYQIVVKNNGMVNLTTIEVTDTLPADLTYISANPLPSSQTGNTLTWSGISLTAGSSMPISITAKVSATPAKTITNIVNVEDTTTNASASDEDVDSTASLLNNDITKIMTGSDAAHTTDPQVTIGEILTYEVVMSVPVGSMTNTLLVDTPQAGLAFVDLTSLTVSNPDTDGSALTDDGLYSSVMIFAPGTGLCTNCVDGTTPGSSNPLIENKGGKITFDFGTLTNSGTKTETITIRYSVIVLDIASNQYILGTTLSNDVIWSWSGGNSLDPTSLPIVSVVEPNLSIDKNAQPIMSPYGAPITFTIDIAHTTQSSADAFDVVVKDVLPPGLAFIVGSEKFTRTSGTLLQPPVFNYDAATTTLTFVWNQFQLGQSAQLEFQATFVGPAPVENSANVEWTSLEIDPAIPGGSPVLLSDYNTDSTERWYDPLSADGVDPYRVSDSVSIQLPQRLPRTGFAPGVVTQLPAMPFDFSYAQTDLSIEIPRLEIKLNIVGVPFGVDNWNLTWLSNNAGWLEGSAFPTYNGNSALTAHAYLADGTAGPFAKLNTLRFGDQIIIHLGGQKYIYEVRQNLRVNPKTMSVLKHEEIPWLTLLTCQTYNERTDDYIYRIAVRAVLVKVE